MAIALIAFWVVFKLLDPVSLESATKQSSAQFFSGLTTAFHGWRADPAQRQVAVVEVTDATLEAFGETWPLPYEHHARVLESIIEGGAAAVLVDIRFARERAGQSLAAFGPAIRLAESRGVPLLFARGEAGNGFGDLPAPLTPYQAITGWRAKPGTYPLVIADEADPHAPGQPTAALQLYLGLCERGLLPGCADPAAFRQPLALRWGTRFDPSQDMVSDTAECWRIGDRGVERLLHAGITAALSLFGATRDLARQPCFYALTLGAEQLHRTGRDGRQVGSLLAGRTVFYGGDMRGEHDVMDVPVLGQIPGVHVHAMAFDNLLTYGRHYFRQPEVLFETPWFELSEAEVLEFAAWLLMILLASVRRASADAAGLAASHGRRGTVVILAAVGAAFAFDLTQRGSLFGAAELALIYALGAVVLLRGFALRHRLHESFWVRLLQVVCLVIVAFTLNELVFRWPGADWFGFVLLWLALGEATSGEADGFVATLSRDLGTILLDIRRRLGLGQGRAAPAPAAASSSPREEP